MWQTICPVSGGVPNRGIGMRPEVRMAWYVEALERYRGGRLSCFEAAELLGISDLHRWNRHQSGREALDLLFGGQPKEQLSCGESQGRVPPGRRNFGNRNQDKPTFVQSGVR